MLVDEFPMTVTGKIRKVQMREAAVEILQDGGRGTARPDRAGAGIGGRRSAGVGPGRVRQPAGRVLRLSTVSTPIAPTGEQWTIRSGDLEVVVVEVGGGLRSFTSAGREVL